jgi:CheY-like chemotaxis protein
VTIARCEETGIEAHLIKPVKQRELLEAIQKLFSQAQVIHTQEPEAASAAKDPQEIDAPAAPPESGSRSLRILLVEDNLVNQKLAVKLLQRQGHVITIAENGQEALTQFRTHAFDLILMDVQMPIMDGLEATEAIRAEEAGRGSHIPIVAMTARAMKGDEERCLAAGMDGYLPKPINAADLLKKIDSFAEGVKPALIGTH